MLQVELMCGKKNKHPGDFYGVDDITWGSFANTVLYGGGVFDVYSFQPSISGSNIVIDKGYILIKNKTYTFGANTPAFWLVRNTDPITLAVPPNTTSQPRFDSIVVVINQRATDPLSDPDATNVVEVKYIPGTVAGRSNTYAELEALPELSGKDFTRIAKVLVPANSSTPSDIADWRIPLGVFDNSPVPSNKNWMMNSELISPRWGWYASDWSKVTITPAKDWDINAGTLSVTVGFDKIFTTLTGEIAPMYPGTHVVWSARMHKVSGTGRVLIQTYYRQGSTRVNTTTKTVYLEGDSNTEVAWVMAPFTLSDAADYHGIETTVVGGNDRVYWSLNKIDFGYIPTAWQARPLHVRDQRTVIYPWTTDFSAIASGTTINTLNYNATKRTVGVGMLFGYMDQDSWSWADIQGMGATGAWERMMSIENQNGIPVRRSTNIVWLNDDYQFRIVKDTTNQSGTLGHIEITYYLEYT